MVKMERLRDIFTDLGLGNVGTFIQSGNVFFDSEEDRAVLKVKIEARLTNELGFMVPTILRTISELEQVMALNPFEGVVVTDDIRLYLIFTSKQLPAGLELPIVSAKNEFEIVAVSPGAVYVVLTLNNGRSGNPAAYIEKAYGVQATARFYATTARILSAASI